VSDGFLDVAAGLGHDFSHLAGHVLGVLLLAVEEDLAGAVEDFGAFGAGVSRQVLKASVAAGNGQVDVLGGGGLELANDVVVAGGIDVEEGFAGAGGDPLAADEVLIVRVVMVFGNPILVIRRLRAVKQSLTEHSWEKRVQARGSAGFSWPGAKPVSNPPSSRFFPGEKNEHGDRDQQYGAYHGVNGPGSAGGNDAPTGEREPAEDKCCNYAAAQQNERIGRQDTGHESFTIRQ